MAVATTLRVREQDWDAYASVPPPPTAPARRQVHAPPILDLPARPEEVADEPLARPVGREFDADIDATELDDRDRPGSTWTARGRTLSRSSLVIRSRRMSVAGRRVLLAVHLIDSEPVPLFGIVQSSEYEGEGLYQICIDFLPVPERAEVKEWLRDRGR